MLNRIANQALRLRQRQSCLGLAATTKRLFATIENGHEVPSAQVGLVKYSTHKGYETSHVDFKEYVDGKNVVVVGYPGAFIPTCMGQHLPGFIKIADQLKKQGTDEILALSVNDPFVVTAFAEYLGGHDLISYVADGNGDLTRALGLELDLSAA